jgi:hypothetical protein
MDGRPAPRRPFGSPAGGAGKPPFRRPGEFRPRPGGDARPPLGPGAALEAITNRELPEAAKQLQETQKLILTAATELLTLTEGLEASHKRLEAALNEAVSEHSLLEDSLLPLVDEAAKARSAVAALYEKMSFQDLAGQRLMKVDDFLAALGRVLGGSGKPAAPKKFKEKPYKGKDRDSDLKGPSAAGEGLGQVDIDQMLDEL